MNDDQQALNTPATEAPSETPTEETQVQETTEAEVEQPTGEATETPSVDEGSKKSAQNRIRELNSKVKSLEEQVGEFTGSIDRQRQQPQYQPQVQPGQEVSPEQYQQDVAARADSIVSLRLEQERVLTRINAESAEAVRAHAELDPTSDKFDKDLSESISQATLAYVRANPTQSVKKFVDSLMKPYQKSLESAKGQAEVEVAKEQAQAALRPTQTSTTEKSASEMTPRELEKKLGIVY